MLRNSINHLLTRAADGLHRRARYWWRLATQGSPPPAAEAAWQRLLACVGDEGLAPTCGNSAICPGLTAAVIPTLWQFGATDFAVRYARRLIAWQKRDGSLPDAGLLHSSLFNTAQAVRGWSLLLDRGMLPEAEPALRRGCGYLVSRIGDDGVVRLPESGGSFDRWGPLPIHLSGLAIAAEYARRDGIAGWRVHIARAVERILRTTDFTIMDSPTHTAAHALESLIDLCDFEPRCIAAAIRGLETAASCQRSDGSVPVDAAHRWTSSGGLAHLAALWFRAGMYETGQKAIECLTSHQSADGGWPGSWGRSAAYFPKTAAVWTIKYFLDAAAAQVAAAFESPDPDLLTPISEDDGRRQALEHWCGALPECAEVIDVGCGGGRYLSALAAMRPGWNLHGVDPSARLLGRVSSNVTTSRCGLLHLDRASDRFDGAYCIEALEHSLVPQRAVDELCRIVRPGGRILIIDKCERFQALSRCEPWERWFAPETVSAWLSRHCDDVVCSPLPLGPQQGTPGLFLAWQATKRAAAASMPARRAA